MAEQSLKTALLHGNEGGLLRSKFRPQKCKILNTTNISSKKHIFAVF